MAIKSETFSRVELTGADAARFMQHMRDDHPNSKAQGSYARGLDVLSQFFGQQGSARPR